VRNHADSRAATLEIVHLAYTLFPADTRVKREALASLQTGRAVGVVALRGAGQEMEETLDGVHVVRLTGSKSRAGRWSYLREYAAFVWRCRRLLAGDARFRAVRVVHVHTLPDFLIWAAAPAQQRGARVILDLHEVFPEFAAAKYPGLFGRIAAWIARIVERAARRRADVTITVNTPIEELLAGRGIGRQERRLVIHNSADPVEFGAPRDPKTRMHLPSLELVYHGTLTALYGLDVAIRGVALARQRGFSAHFTIFGDGPERVRLSKLVADIGLDGAVTLHDSIPQRDLKDRLIRADAGVVPTLLDGMTRYSLSNKLLEYVHLGVPVLAARLPSYGRYLSEEAVWFWTPGDPEDLARAIERFAFATLDQRETRAKRAQDDLASIAWPHEQTRLIKVYEELLRSP
jgi:glycosyltransferase involved in cell wall biosynthesis